MKERTILVGLVALVPLWLPVGGLYCGLPGILFAENTTVLSIVGVQG